MNAWDEMRIAMDEAKARMDAVDSYASEMARLLQGRLRHCSRYVLAELKRELRDFNIHTKEWTK